MALTGNVHGAQSVAKAWVLYDHTAPSITDSFNVTSVTDDALGFFTINFGITMANTNYLTLATTTGEGGDVLAISGNAGNFGVPVIKTTTAIQMHASTGGSGDIDTAEACVVIFGDQ